MNEFRRCNAATAPNGSGADGHQGERLRHRPEALLLPATFPFLPTDGPREFESTGLARNYPERISLSSRSNAGRVNLRMAAGVFRSSKRMPPREVWNAFLGDAELLRKNHITDDELAILHEFAPRGVVTCTGDILFILSTIRCGRDKKQGA